MIDVREVELLAGPRDHHSAPIFQVAMVGGIRPQKNFPLFCRIAQRLLPYPMEFHWIGGGVPPQDVIVPRNVRLTGWLRRDEVLAQLGACHCFMQTSLWEGLPISMLEAMALGLAVLAHPAVGNTELVEDGVTGYLCDSPENFASYLIKFERDRELTSTLGSQCKQLVRKQHDAQRISRQWRELYQTISEK